MPTVAPTQPPPLPPIATSTNVPIVPTIAALALPTLPPRVERIGGPVNAPNAHPGPRWVTLQVGHWRNENLPEELQHLSDNTGASSNGVNEVDVNLAVTRLAAQYLLERGYSVDILDATVPVSYTTDLFLAIHADGSTASYLRGFKAVAPWNGVPASDQFVGILYEEYGKATGLPTDAMTSVNMAHYYAFNSVRYRHATTSGVPGALLEMGFVSNPDDRRMLATEQPRLAWGIANAVDRYFRSGAAGDTPTPYPSFTPTNTSTSTPTPTSTSTSTSTPTETPTSTPVPTELAAAATETATLITPLPATQTPILPTATRTPLPTPTPLTGTITTDGRWLPPMAPNGRRLPPPGSDAPPVLLLSSYENRPLQPDGRERQQSWQQFYVPELGRPIWKKGPLRQIRP